MALLRKLRDSHGSMHPSTKRLIHSTLYMTTALVAYRAQKHVRTQDRAVFDVVSCGTVLPNSRPRTREHWDVIPWRVYVNPLVAGVDGIIPKIAPFAARQVQSPRGRTFFNHWRNQQIAPEGAV